MSGLKSRLQLARQKLLRRGSTASTTNRSLASSATNSIRAARLRPSISLSSLSGLPELTVSEPPVAVDEIAGTATSTSADAQHPPHHDHDHGHDPDHNLNHNPNHNSSHNPSHHHHMNVPSSAPSPSPRCPTLTLETPTPLQPAGQPPSPLASHSRPVPPSPLSASGAITTAPTMAPTRRVWVKRPHASATLVQIGDDDVVDDVRDRILHKYANSLGRSFDAPDLTLRLVSRDALPDHDRPLGPEEPICRLLDAYFPGGQHVTDALLIDVPTRKTPRPSPRVPLYYSHHDDAAAAAHQQTEYFPPMPAAHPSPLGPAAASPHPLSHSAHSIAVLNTGQLPALPSPGGTRRPPSHSHRPKYPRNHTTSPTALAANMPSSQSTSAPRSTPNRPRQGSSASDAKHSPAAAAASAATTNSIPTPPLAISVDAIARQQTLQTSTPSTPRLSSPVIKEKRRKKRPQLEPPSLPAGLLDGSVPPINVLIVEDNIINLRVLGAFMQRLKVRWQRAMNGKEAVTKWKGGGFHLVLMDIQLPVMNGLEATKEIRRLERVNSIGVFSSGGSSSDMANNGLGEAANVDDIPTDDKLKERGLFKSPVIIVALTASSLQSDRHEALAAGCNDFLTKPVNFVWLERKVKEWGCMQALIDFDGWRTWKDFADKSDNNDSTSKLSVSYHSIAPSKKSNQSSATVTHAESNGSKDVDKERRSKRRSLSVAPPPVVTEDEASPPAHANTST